MFQTEIVWCRYACREEIRPVCLFYVAIFMLIAAIKLIIEHEDCALLIDH